MRGFFRLRRGGPSAKTGRRLHLGVPDVVAIVGRPCPRRALGHAAALGRPGRAVPRTLLLYCVNLDDGLTVHDELHHILAGRGLLETGEPRIADGLYQRTYLFTWLVAQSLRLFGDNLFAARLPAVVPMALLVAAMFVWLRATAGGAAAWTASVLFAVSPFAVGYAQFVRFYALQSLAFFLAAIALATLLQAPGGPLRRALLAAGGLAALWLAVALQDTTLLGVAALGAWAVAAIALPWLGNPAVPPRRRLAGLLGGAFLLLVAMLLFWQSGALAELWHRYRWTPVFNEGTIDEFWYYHGRLLLFYPTLWPATGVLGLLAVVAAPRAGLMALVVFATLVPAQLVRRPEIAALSRLCPPLPVHALGHRPRRAVAARCGPGSATSPSGWRRPPASGPDGAAGSPRRWSPRPDCSWSSPTLPGCARPACWPTSRSRRKSPICAGVWRSPRFAPGSSGPRSWSRPRSSRRSTISAVTTS